MGFQFLAFLSISLTFLIFHTCVEAQTATAGECESQIQKVMPCLTYATGKAASPTSDCCTSVKDIKESEPKCLCIIMQQTHNGSPQIKSLGIQEDKLLQLPTACKLQNASISFCPSEMARTKNGLGSNKLLATSSSNVDAPDCLTICPPIPHDPASPYPMRDSKELLAFHKTKAPESSGKIKSWPRYSSDWSEWVEKLRPRYESHWKTTGIFDFIRMTTVPISFQEEMVLGALTMWSSHCNSFIFPGGPMSITLRDILALTHLPIIGPEIPCQIETEEGDFPDFKPLEVTKNGNNYSRYISHFCTRPLEENADYDHVHFLWVLLCKYIFFPSSGHPTADTLEIAKALALKEPIALGKMLLGSVYHNLHLSLSKDPFARLNGCVWIVQLWLFAYFPALRQNILPLGDPILLDFAGIQMSHYTCPLEFIEAMSFFHNLKMDHWEYFIFTSNPVDLPPTARLYVLMSIEPIGAHFWKAFVSPSFLHVGVGTKDQKLGTGQFPCLEGYNPSLWCRQFGFAQLKTNIPKNRFPAGKLRQKLTPAEVLSLSGLDRPLDAVEDLVIKLDSTFLSTHIEFEEYWRPYFATFFPRDPKVGSISGEIYCLPPQSMKRKAKEVVASGGVPKKAKKNNPPRPKVIPTRKSNRLITQAPKRNKVKKVSHVDLSDSESEEDEPANEDDENEETESEEEETEEAEDASQGNGEEDRSDSPGNDQNEQEIEKNVIHPSEQTMKPVSADHPSSQETDPSEHRSSTPGFSVKVNYSDSSFLNYGKHSTHTPPSQDSVSISTPRPELSTLVNPVRTLDMSFFSKRRSSSPFGLHISEGSLAIAKSTISQCLSMDLSLLNSRDIDGLKDALTLLSNSCKTNESRGLLSSLASKVSQCFEYLNTGAKELLSLENRVQAFITEANEADQLEKEAAERKELDKAELEVYETTQKQIQELEEQIAKLKGNLAKIEEKRALYASEQAKAQDGITQRFEKIQSQFSQAQEWEARIEELKEQRESMLEAWQDLKAMDLSSLE